MRLQNIRQVDLNLLATFAAIAEGRSITAAASRLLLTQPAVSRALQRARIAFQDDLLFRSPGGFQLTLRGRKLLAELDLLLPRLEQLVAPDLFDPSLEAPSFRLSGPDKVCTALLPKLAHKVLNNQYRVRFEFLPWQNGIVELLEYGNLDLASHIDEGMMPSHIQTERLYREEWICVVSRDSHFRNHISLKEYLAAEHIVVSAWPDVQTVPDKQLAAIGKKRRSRLRVPYFNVATQCLAGSEMVLTLTSGMRTAVEKNRELRLIQPPRELYGFYFLMVWHPRMNTDPRHSWLRTAVRKAGTVLGESGNSS
jgi:DNA-binding transcriptional LysR family regulator